jgi:hypothetical protein
MFFLNNIKKNGYFKIKISSLWYSEDYIKFKYTTNGIFWKNVKCCVYSPLDECYFMSNKTCHFRYAKNFLSKFKTLDDVKRYEDVEKEQVIKHNNNISENNKRYKEERNNVFKKYS